MYKLSNQFATHILRVTVVGCGGTGGFVAEGLCRLLPSPAELLLVDHDRVEEPNLGRQNFTPDELGRFKSETLAQRLARRFGRPVGYSVFPVGMTEIKGQSLVIGCVDNGPARRDLAKSVVRGSEVWSRWWVDAGNGENYGQILIGNRQAQHLRRSFDKDICFALPLPTIQIPQLLAQRPPQRDCAQAVTTGEQGPVINQAMAATVVEVVRRLIEGTCPWMQLYLDLEAGTLTPVLATPEAVARVTGISKRSLIANYKQ